MLLHLDLGQAPDTAVVLTLGLFSFCACGLFRFGRFFAGGGFGLFRLIEALQEELELGRVELFAALSKETFGESVNLLTKDHNFGPELFVFRKKADIFVRRFDTKR